MTTGVHTGPVATCVAALPSQDHLPHRCIVLYIHPEMKRSRQVEAYDDESDSDIGEPSRHDLSDDEMSSLSFGALSSANKKLQQQQRDEFFDQGSDSDSDAPPEEEKLLALTKRRGKHAPAVALTKKKPPKVRQIHGLEINPKYNDNSLYTDIRFDTAYGKADLQRARKNYAFLDDYRALEIKDLEGLLAKSHMLLDRERQEIEYKVQSLRSRLDTLKNRDLEDQIISEHKRKLNEGYKLGKLARPFFLKNSEKKKLLQKAKFESMSARQRERVVERKRKKRLGREMRELEGQGYQ